MSNEDKVTRQKKSDNKPKSGKIIGVIVLFLILFMAIAAVVSNLSGVSIASFGNTFPSGNLIYDSLPDSIKDIDAYSSGAVLLTDTSVEYIDSSGRLLASNAHLYSQPVMKVNDANVLLYDRGGTDFRIESNSSVYNVFNVNGAISTAAIGAKNNYAYVLNGEGGFQSHLYVYSFRGKKQFEWGSASDYCLAMDLSDNGKNIAIATIGVEQAEYYSKVILFNFRQDTPVFSIDFPDCTVFALDFIGSKSVAAFTDNGVFVIKEDGTYDKVCEYVPSEIRHSSSDDNIKTVAVANHGNTKDSEVIVFNKKYEEQFRINCDSEIFSIQSTDKYVAVISGDKINIYDNENTCVGNIKIGEKCLDAAFAGRTVYVRTVSGIYSFDAYDNVDLTIKKEPETTNEATTQEVSDTEAESELTENYNEVTDDASQAPEETTYEEINFG